ncbi:MAG TPA: hypothetical protein VLM05_17535, partial [Mycobacteriales bacterium]|nr:hypothetical protein [Mycobacteriales bacterium]
MSAPALDVPASAGNPGAKALTGALNRFVTVPADVAQYDTDVETASRALRAEPAAVEALAGAGLPHVADPERGPLFDYDDVMNVGMFSGTGETVPELGLRFLMRFAAAAPASWYEPREWLVGIDPAGSLGPLAEGASGPRIEVRTPDTTAAGLEVLSRPCGDATLPPPLDADLQTGGYELAVRLTGERQTVTDPRAYAIWDGIVTPLAERTVTYQTVPERLRADHHRAWDLGIADCIVASKLLAERLTAAGLTARVRRGYLLGLFGSDHAWCELEEDGVRKPLDPVFCFVARTGDKARG